MGRVEVILWVVTLEGSRVLNLAILCSFLFWRFRVGIRGSYVMNLEVSLLRTETEEIVTF